MGLVARCTVNNPFIMLFVLVCPNELVAFGMDVYGEDDTIRISMLRRSTDTCVIRSSRGVKIIFRQFFVTTILYTNVRKQFT